MKRTHVQARENYAERNKRAKQLKRNYRCALASVCVG